MNDMTPEAIEEPVEEQREGGPIEVSDGLLAFLKDEYDRCEDTTLEEERATAIKRYNGEAYGDEEEGRSQVVARDTFEVVNYMVASILRTVVSGDRVVEFTHKNAELAKEATETIHWLLLDKQNGYLMLHDWLKAGLLEKNAVAMTFMDADTWKRRVHNGVSSLALMQALQAGAKLVEAEPAEQTDDMDRFNVALHIKQDPSFPDYAVPNEEFYCSVDARTIDEALLKGRRVLRHVQDLVAEGIDPDELNADEGHATENLATARDDGRYLSQGTRKGDGRQVWWHEEFARYDENGDGIAELLYIRRTSDFTIYSIDEMEEIDDHPFVDWSPLPMPHRRIGQSIADAVMDLERIRTVLLRQSLDGIYETNMPTTYVHEGSIGETTIEDLLNPRVGRIVRYRGAQAPVERQAAFSAAEGFRALEYITGERESRTGITRLNQGLDAEALNKMLCIETPIPMADGAYKRLGDIDDGDWIVGSDGEPVRVLAAHVIHDPERAYRIGFKSGEYIDAGGEHLWTVQTDNDKRYGKFQTVDTDRLFEMMQAKGRVYIPRVQRPQTGFERELPLDPYMLGLWLGDGNSYAPRITTMEAETAEYAAAWADEHGGLTVDAHQNSGAATSYYVKGLYTPLREMKLLKRGDAEKDADIVGKHIPEEYFSASYRQRLELLRGLMDTDGCHHSRSLAIFCQKGGRLLDDVVRLIESLGGWPSVKKLTPEGRFRHDGEHYQVTFTLADCPFKLARKVKGWVVPVLNATTQVVRSIERIDIKPMRCLTVDAPDGLFCVGRRFTVTHNTATGTALMQDQGQQMEEYVARNFGNALAKLFTKKARLLKRYAAPFQVPIDGQYKEVDPSKWPEDMIARPRIGLGASRKEKRVQSLMGVMGMQKEMVAAGMSNLVTPSNLFNSAKAFIAETGLGEANEFFTDPAPVNPQTGQREPLPQPEKPDPEMAKVQAQVQLEQIKMQGQQQAEAVKVELERQKAEAKLAMEQMLGQAKLEMERERAQFEAELAQAKSQAEIEMAYAKMEAEFALKERQMERDHNVKMAAAEVNISDNRSGGSLAE